MNDKKFIILILCLFVLNAPITLAGEYGGFEYEAYKAGESIGASLRTVLLWGILITIVIIAFFIIILRAVLSIDTRVELLDEIKKELAELNTLNNDIRILLTSIDNSLNHKKPK